MRIIHTDSQRREDFRVGDQVRTRKGKLRSVVRVRKTCDGTLMVTIRGDGPFDYQEYSSLPSRHAGYPLSNLTRVPE